MNKKSMLDALEHLVIWEGSKESTEFHALDVMTQKELYLEAKYCRQLDIPFDAAKENTPLNKENSIDKS